MKYYERWWQDNQHRNAEFAAWLADSDLSSRAAVATLVDELAYAGRPSRPMTLDVLECGPGTYLDHQLLWTHRPHVAYHALDVTPAIVEVGRAKGLDDVRLGSIEEIPHKAGAMDVVYCRHVLEHLPSYRTALLEMHRVARRCAVAVLWRLDVDAEADAIYYNTVQGVADTFHNMYSQKAISAWLTSLRIAHRWERADADWLLILDAGHTPG
jgi:ubiquinone/menaquinone biosynthesis C-methylase UbiE